MRLSYDKTDTSNKLLHLCQYCNKYQDISGYWDRSYDFNVSKAKTRISHGICPECLIKHFPVEFSLLCEEGKIEFRTKTTSDNRVLYGCFLRN